MHALFEQNVPYALPWMNEGVTALFEEFRLQNGGINGTFRSDHWCISHLLKTGLPALHELTAMDWRELAVN